MKVVTKVRGKVPPNRRQQFEAGYRSLKESSLPQGLESSLLLRHTAKPDLYVIETIWGSREALQAMRSKEKPKAVALFEEIGVSPTIEIYEGGESVP